MTDIVIKDIKNGSEYYYGGCANVEAEDVSYDNTTSGMTADNVQDALDEIIQEVGNGKELIADAITDKGVQTSASDSFQTMATNIGLIQTESISDKLFSSAINNGLNGNFYVSGNGTYRYTYTFKDSDIKKGISIAQGNSGTQNVGNTLYAYYDDNGNCVCKQVSTGFNFYTFNTALYVDGEPNKIYFGTWTGSGRRTELYYDIENDQFVSTTSRYLDNYHIFNNTAFSNVSLVPHADTNHTGTLLYITPVIS